jgi:glycosyltransferase involved in cell wall biosynthesis
MNSSLQKISSGVTIVIPAYNEEGAISQTIDQLKTMMVSWTRPHEIIVVNDGSADATPSVAAAAGVRVISHPINSGYGRSLLTGIESATYDTIAIIDADGTYPGEKLPDLLSRYDQGFHMVVAARQGRYYEGSFTKKILRILFRWLAEFACGRDIPDINSGLRVFDRRPVLASRGSLSTGFSFTTTITLLFMLNNLFVAYVPISYKQRVGQSKVRLFRDSLRSLQIILTTIAQFNPLKLFLLLMTVNLIGNVMLWIVNPSLIPVIAWNAVGVISAVTILGLILIKPAAKPASDQTLSV